TREMRDNFGFIKSQHTRKTSKRSRKSGNRKASKEINHHLSGCRNALQQVNRNRMANAMFSRMRKRFVNFRSDAMGDLKLQIFLFSSPLQNVFFFAGQKAIALLVDLVQDLIDSFLRDIGNFFKGLGSGHMIIKFVFWMFGLFFLFRIEEVAQPVEK